MPKKGETAARRMSEAHQIAVWFIKEYLGREITKADWGGPHVSHAKRLLLMKIGKDDIIDAILAYRDGLLGDDVVKLNYLAGLTTGEPSIMNRWLEYKSNPPPMWSIEPYRIWQERTGYVESSPAR